MSMMIPPLPGPSNKQWSYISSLLEDVELAVFYGQCAPNVLFGFEQRYARLITRLDASKLIEEMLAVLGRN